MSKKSDSQNLDKASVGGLLNASPTAIDAKLEILKKALQNKTYNINSNIIAKALLEDIANIQKISIKNITEEESETI